VCGSEVSALILFKSPGFWTVYWTDYSRLEREQFIMWFIKLAKT